MRLNEPDSRGTAHLLFDLGAVEHMTEGRTNTVAATRVVEIPYEEEQPVVPIAPPDEHPEPELELAARNVLGRRSSPFTPSSDERMTCVIADDHPIVREAMSSILEHNGFEVVGHASDGEEALAEILSKRPTIALVDLRLPTVDGVEVARQASRLARETAVVLYTGADPLLLSGALESGARGFLLKEAPVADIARAVKMVADGHLYFDPALASFLMSSPGAKTLTGRELDILLLLADGCTNEAIAKRLHLSPETIRTHVRALLRKLDAHTRTEAVATALRERLIA